LLEGDLVGVGERVGVRGSLDDDWLLPLVGWKDGGEVDGGDARAEGGVAEDRVGLEEVGEGGEDEREGEAGEREL